MAYAVRRDGVYVRSIDPTTLLTDWAMGPKQAQLFNVLGKALDAAAIVVGSVVIDTAIDDHYRMVGAKTVHVASVKDMYALSYYTLCRLQEVTHYADPIRGLPIAIAQGEFKGLLTTDGLGNFIAFE